jgi:hypothetical protein
MAEVSQNDQRGKSEDTKAKARLAKACGSTSEGKEVEVEFREN